MSEANESQNRAGRALRGRTLALLAPLLVLLPRISEACAVCSAGRDDESRWAFILMTAFMTLMPFVLVGGVIFWLRRRLIDLEAVHDEARGDASPSPSSV